MYNDYKKPDDETKRRTCYYYNVVFPSGTRTYKFSAADGYGIVQIDVYVAAVDDGDDDRI